MRIYAEPIEFISSEKFVQSHKRMFSSYCSSSAMVIRKRAERPVENKKLQQLNTTRSGSDYIKRNKQTHIRKKWNKPTSNHDREFIANITKMLENSWIRNSRGECRQLGRLQVVAKSIGVK